MNKTVEIKQFIANNKYLLSALLILLIYLSPNIFFPGEAHYLIHDNLDSNVLWYKNLGESGQMFGPNSAIIPNSVGGMPRGCYPSELNLLHLLYLFFNPLVAYNINSVLMHFLAFFSMYVFAKRYIFKNEFKWALVSVSLIFALLPFWPSGGAAVTAQPLLLYAFLNILNYDLKWRNWLIILIIPFYSLLVLANFFFMILLGLFFLCVTIKRMKINFYFILACLLFVFTSVVAEHKLFEMQFIDHFESHRTDSLNFGTLNLKGVIGVSLLHFFKGQYHFHSLQSPMIILMGVISIFITKQRSSRIKLIALFALAYSISLLYILPDWIVLNDTMKSNKLLKSISLRFYSLYPIVWYILFGYSCLLMLKSEIGIVKKAVPFFLIITACFCVFSVNDKDYYETEFAENTFFRTYFDRNNDDYDTFDGYYKVELFKKIKDSIQPGNYYIGCIGLAPEIAQYNGYNTIDGYFCYQPKSHNDRMQKISRAEMNLLNMKSLGNHCVLVSREVEEGKKIINDLKLDFDEMKQIGTKYIFSSKKINNGRLLELASFSRNNDALFVYSIL